MSSQPCRQAQQACLTLCSISAGLPQQQDGQVLPKAPAAAVLPGSAQQHVNRQQVFAHDVAFEDVAELKPVSDVHTRDIQRPCMVAA